MAEFNLKRKVTLRKKQEQVNFTFDDILKIKFFWGGYTPYYDTLDLALFFKKKDGFVDGVSSNDYRDKKSDLDSFDQFPYILHLGDDAEEPVDYSEDTEQINVASPEDIDEAYVCFVRCVATNELDATYTETNACIEVQSDSGDYLEVLVDSPDGGPVYYVCSIKNSGGIYTLKNVSQVMNLKRTFEDIPGFALTCNQPFITVSHSLIDDFNF